MATEEGGWDDFWPKDKADRHDWRDVLAPGERPILSFIPETFMYPERYDDNLDLNNFDPKNPPRHTSSDSYETWSKTTPKKLRTPDNYNERTKWEGSHKGALVKPIAIYGDKDLLTGQGGPQQVCHANAVAISAEDGWVIDLLRGVQPGISWPDVRLNLYYAKPDFHAEEGLGYWVIVPVLSPTNVNIIPALIKVLLHNGNRRTKLEDRVRVTDVCPIRLAPKGWWFYAFPIQYRDGPNIRIFNPETGEKIHKKPGESRRRKNGIIFPSSNDPQLMLHASARWLHDVEKVKEITLADDFNPLQENILKDLRTVSRTWFGEPMKKRVIEWNTAVNGKPEEEKTGAPDPNAPPVRPGPDPANPEKDAPGPSTRVTKRTLVPYVDDIEGLLDKTSIAQESSDEDDTPVAGPSRVKSGKRRARTPSESSGSDASGPESPLPRPKTKKMKAIDS